MSDISLTFRNNSNDTNNSQIVIFQKNVAINFQDQPIAWKVIKDCGPGQQQLFTYSPLVSVTANNSTSNTSQSPVCEGMQFSVAKDKTGELYHISEKVKAHKNIQVANSLSKGLIDANVYRSGSLLAKKASIEPLGVTSFKFEPTLWIGAVSLLEEGSVMNEAITNSINTELSLDNIKSADIVMTGGGPGGGPFKFALENVVYE